MSKMSLPSRGAWIEIVSALGYELGSVSRSPRGERGLKSVFDDLAKFFAGRSPRGERGLK